MSYLTTTTLTFNALRWWRTARCGCVLFLMLGWLPVRGQEGNELEYEVKAAFLVKFAMFVQWPAEALPPDLSEPFVIGILGADPFGAKFDAAVKNARIGGRPIQIRRAQSGAELKGCQIVYISSSEAKRMPTLLAELKAQAVLTVADQSGFAATGGMIGFYKEKGKVRFEINPDAVERAGLKVSSKLMQVGRRVAEREGTKS
jgi:hypothetical protein